MKKNNSVAKIFLVSLLKSVVFIILLLFVGLVSYKISYSVLSGDELGIVDSSDAISDIIEDAQTDDISKNLIFVCNEEKITNVMLEICNTKTNNMDYVTIPVRAEYTIPTSMYQKLCSVNEDVPQIVRIGRFRSYFPNEEDAYGYGELIMEKMLGIKISYYTVIDQETYDSHYRKVWTNVKYKRKASATASPAAEESDAAENVAVRQRVSVASDTYINELKAIQGNQESIAEFIKNQYSRVNSNLTVYNKIGYVECYEKMNVDYFHYWGIPGDFDGRVFRIDSAAAKRFLDDIVDNTASYSKSQNLSKRAATSAKKDGTSKGLSIIVLNGSRINGLASSTQERLNEEGYSVGEIGDYTTETLTRTRIIVKSKGAGSDLLAYFNDPELVVGDVKEGYDIEIIVGTADANQ